MKHLLAVITLAFAPLPAASSAFSDAFQAELDAGRISSAMQLARGTLETTPDSREAQFALGIAQFLSAVEGLGQGFYRFGLKNNFQNQAMGLAGLPFFRLPVPANSNPEQVSYEGLRDVLADFVINLTEAEATLAAVSEGPVILPIDLGTVRIDLDGDGSGSADERLAEIFDALNGRLVVDKDNLGFNFDESDVPWLRGYCHLLMALAEIPLAHDWERPFNATFHSLFPDSEIPSSLLAVETRRLVDALNAYHERPEGPPSPAKPDDMDWEDWQETEAYSDYTEFRRLQTALWASSFADIIAFIHLFDLPVVEPERARGARHHLLAVIELSRENWRLVNAETDDDNEWLPNPRQTQRFSNLSVSSEIIAGWHTILDEFEAVLNGETLIRHWRFAGDRGVNIQRMFDEPGRLDPVMIAAGPGVLPYLEDGETLDFNKIQNALGVAGGGYFAYFAWFN